MIPQIYRILSHHRWTCCIIIFLRLSDRSIIRVNIRKGAYLFIHLSNMHSDIFMMIIRSVICVITIWVFGYYSKPKLLQKSRVFTCLWTCCCLAFAAWISNVLCDVMQASIQHVFSTMFALNGIEPVVGQFYLVGSTNYWLQHAVDAAGSARVACPKPIDACAAISVRVRAASERHINHTPNCMVFI